MTIVVDDVITHGVITELLTRMRQLEEKKNKLEEKNNRLAESFRQFNETVNEQKSRQMCIFFSRSNILKVCI